MTTPIDPTTQTSILTTIRELVPDKSRNCSERRHALMLGAILALKAIDHNLIPPAWFMLVLAGRSEELFREVKL